MNINISPAGMSALAQSGAFSTQESLLEVRRQKKELFIGIPKESSFQENRISLVPESVALLVNNGHRIRIEAGAGSNATFTDNDYSEAGAEIVYSPAEVYESDIILKVAPLSTEELSLTKDKQTIISIVQAHSQNKEYFKHLSQKKITGIGFEYIKDQTDLIPVIRAMSEIVGSTAILIAAEYLTKDNNGQGIILGGITGIPPTEIVILGAGTVGEYAARAAIGLGANVKVFDSSVYRLKRLQNNIGRRVYTSTINPRLLRETLHTADVAIGAIYSTDGRTPCIVSEEMVSEMRYGSVIVDVSIDQGGCFETSEVTNHNKPTFRKYGVIHYCVPNIASRVSRTASYALSNIFTPILSSMADVGGMEELLWQDVNVRHGVYMFKGTSTNKFISDYFNLPFRDIDLIMASRI